jgi:hypothetical protein
MRAGDDLSYGGKSEQLKHQKWRDGLINTQKVIFLEQVSWKFLFFAELSNIV